MLTLYLAPGSSSMAPHIALHEVGVPFEPRLVSLAQKANRAPEYLAVNPEGKVPTLVADGRPLTEVAAILFYLAKRYPDARLLPHDDLALEAEAISWMSFIASTVHPARRQGIEHVREVLGLADARLGSSAWALGALGAIGAYSIADIHLFRLYWRLRNAFQLAPADFPRLAAHHDRMLERPAVQRTLEIEAKLGYELPR
jgi:glutathione S-transferase